MPAFSRIAIGLAAAWPGGVAGTEVDAVWVAPGFRVEKLYEVPEASGSWVSICVDPKGRLLVSDQYGPLHRITPDREGTAVRVEKLELPLGSAHGLTFLGNDLYAVVAEKVHGGPGLFRARDTDGDGELDTVALLAKLDGTGEHGPHAVVSAADGQSLYIAAGNGTSLPPLARAAARPEWADASPLPPVPALVGSETRGRVPGGWICRTDLEGRTWTLLSAGYRNHYDLAVNRSGEIFTFDSDTENDLNLPWYRPTRVLHAVSGADFGWRPGAAKLPVGSPETLPAVVALGLGSPTGVTFGYGTSFPARYTDALWVADWSFGKLTAVHLRPDGASYRGEPEPIASGLPLPITGLTVNRVDGAIYFVTGGRRMQSALYRLRWTGENGAGRSIRTSVEPRVVAASSNPSGGARDVRRALEVYHGIPHPDAIARSWTHLGSSDPFLRGAALRAIESQPVGQWRERALAETDPLAGLMALLALARSGDDADRQAVLQAADRWPLSGLPRALQTEKMRLLGRCIAGRDVDTAAGAGLLRECDPFYPADDPVLNAALAELLVALRAPQVIERTLQIMATAPARETQIEHAALLRHVTEGWTDKTRRAYFAWLQRAGGYRGGAAFRPTIQLLRKEAIAAVPERERAALGSLLDEAASSVPVADYLIPDNRPPHAWTVAELLPQVERALAAPRDVLRGRKLAGAVGCFACHTIAAEGGALGPDLSRARGRFGVRDLLEAIVEPNREIGDQYGTVEVTFKDGGQQQGRLVNQTGKQVHLNANLFDPTDLIRIDRDKVSDISPSRVSLMPPGLIDRLEIGEIADLVAFIMESESSASGERSGSGRSLPSPGSR